jgi:hypothetical protein
MSSRLVATKYLPTNPLISSLDITSGCLDVSCKTDASDPYAFNKSEVEGYCGMHATKAAPTSSEEMT